MQGNAASFYTEIMRINYYEHSLIRRGKENGYPFVFSLRLASNILIGLRLIKSTYMMAYRGFLFVFYFFPQLCLSSAPYPFMEIPIVACSMFEEGEIGHSCGFTIVFHSYMDIAHEAGQCIHRLIYRFKTSIWKLSPALPHVQIIKYFWWWRSETRLIAHTHNSFHS